MTVEEDPVRASMTGANTSHGSCFFVHASRSVGGRSPPVSDEMVQENRQETTRQEAARQEAARQEATRQEAARQAAAAP